MAVEIIVPRDENEPIVGHCLICKARFYAGEENTWQRHVGVCARGHMDEIQAMRPSVKNKGTMWDPEFGDPEIERHFRRVRERMKEEGRTEILPNEKAGFS